jgi:hypothetical protein
MRHFFIRLTLLMQFVNVTASAHESTDLQEEARSGNPHAQSDLADTYYNVQYFDQAVFWYTKAAEQGHAASQYKLAEMYRHGEGVARDDARAAHWFLQAAEQGLKEAQLYIGLMYYYGTGLARDYSQAAHWLANAAEQGQPVAQYSLGVLYDSGMGVRQDRVLALKWLTISAAGGYPDAGNYKPVLEQSMANEQVARAQRLAREWLEQHTRRME